MSFILDALKKSESDRQRQSGPALFEVKVAPPRTGLPLWAVAVAALLVVNLAIVMWMLWRQPQAATPAPAGALRHDQHAQAARRRLASRGRARGQHHTRGRGAVLRRIAIPVDAGLSRPYSATYQCLSSCSSTK